MAFGKTEPSAQHSLWLRIALAERRLGHFERLLDRKAGYDPEQSRDARGRWDGDGGSGSEPPEVPKGRPPVPEERNGAIKAVARWLAKYGGPIGKAIGAAYWLYEYDFLIEANLDPAKSLEELQRDVDHPKQGYQIHHIVEQTLAERDGFPRSLIHNRDNLVRVPTLKHRDITSWYQTKSDEFGGLSPRDYLRGRAGTRDIVSVCVP